MIAINIFSVFIDGNRGLPSPPETPSPNRASINPIYKLLPPCFNSDNKSKHYFQEGNTPGKNSENVPIIGKIECSTMSMPKSEPQISKMAADPLCNHFYNMTILCFFAHPSQKERMSYMKGDAEKQPELRTRTNIPLSCEERKPKNYIMSAIKYISVRLSPKPVLLTALTALKTIPKGNRQGGAPNENAL
jgi:hypothetical protein